jgi:hypothetical protein
MTNRGGKREGAGRKAGAANAKTRAIADTAATQGLMPLEVILKAMREAQAGGDTKAAADYAAKAAPYCHPRLSGVSLDLSGISNEQLLEAAK